MGVEKTRGNGSGFVGQLSARSYIFLLVALAVAVMARILFLWRGPLLGSDSLSYYGVAKAIVGNVPQEADVFWHNLFCYWEAIVIFFGASYYTALPLASFIPGVLLIVPIFLMSHRLFGQSFAFVAALAAAVHPRLVEYSVNGSIETTYSLCALLGLWGLTTVLGAANGVVWRTAVSGAGLRFAAKKAGEFRSFPLRIAAEGGPRLAMTLCFCSLTANIAAPILLRQPQPRP